jgi:nucleoside phosphorylase
MKRAVVLTALPVEYNAVREHLMDCSEHTHAKGTIYEKGRFEEWDVLIAETGSGNETAAIEAERAIGHFSPDVLMFVGVAGGLKDVKLGDVVAATKVYGFTSGKADVQFRPRPELEWSNHRLEQRARAESKKPDWKRRIKNQSIDAPADVLVGPIAAGPCVVSSTRSFVYTFLKKEYGDALAVEMEGRGCLAAARANDEVRAIIVRGISDLIDDKEQTDQAGWQKTASAHASAFAFEMLSKLKEDIPPNP